MRTLCRIYQRPDGGIAIVNPAWDDRLNGFGRTRHTTEAEWYAWAVTKGMPLDWISLGDIERAMLPQDRTNRHKWRMQAGRVQPDLTVPDPPHPKQGLLDQIDQATSVAQVKVLMAKLVRGERV